MIDTAPGSVRGIREFLIGGTNYYADWTGHLLGPYTFMPWTPGLNYARCLRNREAVSTWNHPLLGISSSRESELGLDSLPAPADMSESCVCGFYGVFEPMASLSVAPLWVTGIIEGSGRAVVGEKGFRVERARILTLVLRRSTRSGWRERQLSSLEAIIERYNFSKIFESMDSALEEFPLGNLDASGEILPEREVTIR
jgi:hypothetical protein